MWTRTLRAPRPYTHTYHRHPTPHFCRPVVQVLSAASLSRMTATRPRFKCPTCPAVMLATQAVALVIE